jgi:hypothetical protein
MDNPIEKETAKPLGLILNTISSSFIISSFSIGFHHCLSDTSSIDMLTYDDSEIGTLVVSKLKHIGLPYPRSFLHHPI